MGYVERAWDYMSVYGCDKKCAACYCYIISPKTNQCKLRLIWSCRCLVKRLEALSALQIYIFSIYSHDTRDKMRKQRASKKPSYKEIVKQTGKAFVDDNHDHLIYRAKTSHAFIFEKIVHVQRERERKKAR